MTMWVPTGMVEAAAEGGATAAAEMSISPMFDFYYIGNIFIFLDERCMPKIIMRTLTY
jgi:hypothetical protein